MKNLAHSASFDSDDKDAPSNPGIKQAWLLELTSAEPDLTLEAIVQRLLAGLGLKTSEAAVRRFFKRHTITFKKNAARRRTGSARRIPGSRTLEGKSGQP